MGTKKAVILGLKKKLPKQEDQHSEENLEELKLLLKTLGVETVDSFVYKYSKLNPAQLIGSGKLDEIKQSLTLFKADILVIDHPLTPLQVRNLEKITCCQILDRSLVIINIFSSHAKSREAKLQVEIAELEYLLPRLTGAWTHFQRQKGGGAMSRGMGETQIEVDRRRARQRISILKKELKTIKVSRSVQRKKRSNTLKVALVGYTNSGKTSIMSTLSKLHGSGKDELFATLDSKTKVLDPSSHPKVLISDTVGFIKDLPHDLIESFKSTLEEVRYADLLVHVVDLSNDAYLQQIETTESVLKEIGAKDLPYLLVFNKTDKIENELLFKIARKKFPQAIFASSFDKEDMRRLRKYIISFFKDRFATKKIKVPNSDEKTIAYIYSNCLIKAFDYSHENEIEFDLCASEPVMSRLKEYIVCSEEGENLNETQV